MNKKILAFGASNSSASINKKLATFAANRIEGADINILDLNDFEMPIYSMDRENASGIPELAAQFKQHIKDSDGIIISFAEHNGAYSAAFKNIFDWTSRIEGGIWEDKPMYLLSTSPGGRGGITVLNLASSSFKFMAAKSIQSFALPSFYDNFSESEGIKNDELLQQFENELANFITALG